MTPLKVLVITILSIFATSAFGQYGNEWIDYDKEYFKIKVAVDGIYRISHATLAENGLGNKSGANFQLFCRGEEVPVYRSTSSVMQDGDFLEFFGRKNRGEFDRELFEDPDKDHLHASFSMYTDTAVYFLTYSENQTGLTVNAIENDLEDAPEPEPYYMCKDEFVVTEQVQKNRLADNISFSTYGHGEGFTSFRRRRLLKAFKPKNIYTEGPAAIVEVEGVTASLTEHEIVVHIEEDTLFKQSGFGIFTFNPVIEYPADRLTNTVWLNTQNYAGNSIGVARTGITYPRLPDMSGLDTLFFTHPGGSAEQHFAFEGLAQTDDKPIVYNVSDNIRLEGSIENNALHFVLPPGTEQRDLFIATNAGIREVSQIAKTTFTTWDDNDTEYIIISHPRFRSGGDIIGDYLDFRTSEIGGSYKAEYYNIEDIYDQFGYGIRRHPQSIRNFATFISDNWPSAKFAFIIGKGIDYDESRFCDSLCTDWFAVPTFGIPGSDNLLFALDGSFTPFIPVGRLPAVNQEEVAVYLDKVIAHANVINAPQTIDSKLWTKNFLHLGGGADSDQQGQILAALNSMKARVENSIIGGVVDTYTKTSTNSVTTTVSEEILNIMAEGTNVVTFFGHSSNSQLDFQINDPIYWNNLGKYPVFNAMGCNAGQIHKPYRSLSELFVLEPERGAIIFIAGSGSQYLNTLSLWGNTWYREIANNFENTTVGQSVLRSLVSFASFPSNTHTLLRQQQTINGDPAIDFYPSLGQDYLLDPSSARVMPDRISAKDSSFTLQIDLINIGLNISDSVGVLVEQQLPDNSVIDVFNGKVELDKSITSLEITLPVRAEYVGQNRLFITVDPENLIKEYPDPDAENNNTTPEGVPVFILDNRITSSYPDKFAIVTSEKPVFIANSTDALAPQQLYHLEIDTSAAFDSPAQYHESVTQFGGTIKWTPEYNFIPNTVYYWRVSQDTVDGRSEFLWDVSSFLYSPGKREGWNQSHHDQIETCQFNGISYDSQHIAFDNIPVNVWVKNEAMLNAGDEAAVFIDNDRKGGFFTRFNRFPGNVFAAVVEPVTAEFWRNPPEGAYGALNGTNGTVRTFAFPTDTITGREALINFLEDTIPSGHYVIFYTYQRNDWMDYHPEDWEGDSDILGTNIFEVIEKQYPESVIRTLKDIGSRPYTIIYQKDVGVIEEALAENIEQTINVEYNFLQRRQTGSATSPVIGPSSSWSDIQWRNMLSENPDDDSISLAFTAFNHDFTDSIEGAFLVDDMILIDTLSADEFPWLSLQLSVVDSAERTSPNLLSWKVLYTQYPDLAFNAGELFEVPTDSVPAGSDFSGKIMVENISDALAAGFRVRAVVIDPDNERDTLYFGLSDMEGRASEELEILIPEISKEGMHRVVLEINPDGERNELREFNNIAFFDFDVVGDTRNPILDVTFDDRHIVNYEVVSPKPFIEIAVSDDNPYLYISDPADVILHLRYPDGVEQEITADDPLRTFIPAEATEDGHRSAAKVIFTPDLEDGFYRLTAQAKDANGNTSGTSTYAVIFEVVRESTVSPLQVFPNPARQYVFMEWTVTGLELPESIEIELYDLQGKLIRTITPIAEDLYAGNYRIKLDLGGIASGAYVYKMYYSGDGIRQKFDFNGSSDHGILIVTQ